MEKKNYLKILLCKIVNIIFIKILLQISESLNGFEKYEKVNILGDFDFKYIRFL